MTQTRYPYLDLTVLPELEKHVIAPHAAVLFGRDLDRIFWANGEGAQLIGAPAVRAALDGDVSVNPAMIRQIGAAADKLTDLDEANAIIRVKSGFQTKLVGFSVKTMSLPGGEIGILLTTERLHGRHHLENQMAQAAVDCLDGYSHASAIVTDTGNLLAQSEHFGSLDVSDDTLSRLVRDVAVEDDRLVKRPIDTAQGQLPAGIARLGDDKPLHLLVIAGSVSETTLETDRFETSVAETASDAGLQPAADEPPAPLVGAFSSKRQSSGAPSISRWYFKPTVSDTTEPAEPAEPAEPPVDQLDFTNPEPSDEEDQVSSLDEPRSQTPSATIEIDQTESPHADRGALFQDLDSGASLIAAETKLVSEAAAIEESEAEITDETDEDLIERETSDFQFKAFEKPVRFVWEMDTDAIFTTVSKELGQVVGPKAADIEGLGWSEVGRLFGISNYAEITEILDREDTWSGKTVLWPIEGTDLRVPIDLAGLPSYGKTRSFIGFNGFGTIRTTDTMVDATVERPFFSGSEGDEWTEESELPASDSDSQTPIGDKIVDLSTRRNPAIGRSLSENEQEAFAEIGEKLADGKIFESQADATPDADNATPADTDEPDEPDRSADQTAPDDESTDLGHVGFIPSAFAGKKKSPIEPPSATDYTPDAPQVRQEVDTSILSRLPIPVLVYRDDQLLFANDDFSETTGYPSLGSLADAGGVEALFKTEGSSIEGTKSQIFHRDGSQLPFHAHVQRVPWDDHRAMLLTLRNGGPDDRRDDSNDGDISPGGPFGEQEQVSPGPDPSPSEERMAHHLQSPKLATVTSLRSSGDIGGRGLKGLTLDEMRDIVDTATDGVLVIDGAGTLKAINSSAEALFDVSSAAVQGRQFSDLLAPESHQSAMDYLSGMCGTGVASILNDGREVIGKTENGGLIPLFMTIGKLSAPNFFCAVVRDITSWKKAEEELLGAKKHAELASNQKTDFLAKVSHEIRTPLNAIIGFSDLMIEERFGAIDNDRYRGYLRDIHRSGNHVLDLINDLLDISRIEAGKVDLTFDACDLNAIVSETSALSQPLANKEHVIIRTSLSAVVPKVVADPRSLRQIVLNLVSNGIKYTKAGGQVIISTVYEETGEVVLRIRDTGIGMSELELIKALTPFQQINSVATAEKEGTGLGLPLTKAMVEANRARFSIESEPDEGTLVSVHFPTQRVLADR